MQSPCIKDTIKNDALYVFRNINDNSHSNLVDRLVGDYHIFSVIGEYICDKMVSSPEQIIMGLEIIKSCLDFAYDF